METFRHPWFKGVKENGIPRFPAVVSAKRAVIKKSDIKKGATAPYFCSVLIVLTIEALRQRCHR